MLEKKYYKKMYLISYFLATAVILLQFGCSSKSIPSNESDNDILFDGNCRAPCYLNITPGVTTREEVLSILKKENLENVCQEYDNSLQSGSRGIFCQNTFLGISFQNNTDVVEGIGFELYREITVDEIIIKYGEPDGIKIRTYDYQHGNPLYEVDMTICYDSITTCLFLARQPSDIFDLQPATLVESVGYFDQNSYRENALQFQAWHGYGEYIE